MPILPERLRPGDTVALVAPASPPLDPGAIDHAVAALEALCFRVKVAPNARRRRGFLAGTDRERAGDLMRMFADRKVRAIFCVRGGYGSGRLLPLLDYKVVRKNPKVFVGYSDITALHCAFLGKANLLSFHGPTAAGDLIKPDFSDFARESLLCALMGNGSTEERAGIARGLPPGAVSILRRGIAKGRLVGGNLSILCSLQGTPFQPSYRSSILFIEDVGEAPYRFDRMLTHLLNCGVLQTVAGIAVGICEKCADPRAEGARGYRQTLADVIKERLVPLKIPVVSGLPFGHTRLNATIPVGAQATLDAIRGDLIITGPVVR